MLLLRFLPLLLLGPAVTADPSTCKKGPNSPEVTVRNWTHLRVTWATAFTGCHSTDVSKVEVAEHGRNGAKTHATIKFDEKEIDIPVDPCLKHLLFIRITFKEFGTDDLVSSFNRYNEGNNILDLYAGDLKKIIKGICLKKNGTINIPVPEKLDKCIVSKGDINNTEFQYIGDSSDVTIIYKDPSGAGPNIREQVSVAVSEDCSTTTAEPPVTEATEESDVPKILLYAGIGAGGLLAYITLASVATCLTKRRLHTLWMRNLVREEGGANDLYGLYYIEGTEERIDQGAVEVIDNNEYYGM